MENVDRNPSVTGYLRMLFPMHARKIQAHNTEATLVLLTAKLN